MAEAGDDARGAQLARGLELGLLARPALERGPDLGIGVLRPALARRETWILRPLRVADGLRQLQVAGFGGARGELITGEPIEEIARHAGAIGADLIVVGHKHVGSRAARWWRGSVSKSLIEHAPCSVLCVVLP